MKKFFHLVAEGAVALAEDRDPVGADQRLDAEPQRIPVRQPDLARGRHGCAAGGSSRALSSRLECGSNGRVAFHGMGRFNVQDWILAG